MVRVLGHDVGNVDIGAGPEDLEDGLHHHGQLWRLRLLLQQLLQQRQQHWQHLGAEVLQRGWDCQMPTVYY